MELNDHPCPKCGCWMKKEFKCNCGDVHDDYCCNCNRWVSLAPDQYVELGVYDARCTVGHSYHEHSPQEQTDRLQAYFDSTKK